MIYGLLTGRPAEEALRLGWAHGALLTTYHGDVTMARLEEVEALAKGCVGAGAALRVCACSCFLAEPRL